MTNKNFFVETNSVPSDLLLKVSEFIKLRYSSKELADKLIMIDFYQYLEKRHLELYVLIYYDENDIFSANTEDVRASLLFNVKLIKKYVIISSKENILIGRHKIKFVKTVLLYK